MKKMLTTAALTATALAAFAAEAIAKTNVG